ncbi:MAG: T9SS type A sorting domain-containing protein [Candidatus Cloacimonetes bacterium]|nr:T9SS type A sorting domain-containing protein [Candidatus Cloacimonadota bacterium]
MKKILVTIVLLAFAICAFANETEIIEKRTFFSKTFDLENSKYRLKISIEPVHYLDDYDNFIDIPEDERDRYLKIAYLQINGDDRYDTLSSSWSLKRNQYYSYSSDETTVTYSGNMDQQHHIGTDYYEYYSGDWSKDTYRAFDLYQVFPNLEQGTSATVNNIRLEFDIPSTNTPDGDLNYLDVIARCRAIFNSDGENYSSSNPTLFNEFAGDTVMFTFSSYGQGSEEYFDVPNSLGLFGTLEQMLIGTTSNRCMFSFMSSEENLYQNWKVKFNVSSIIYDYTTNYEDHIISGNILDYYGNPMSDVELGNGNTTDENGDYEIIVPWDDPINIIPQKENYVFNPEMHSYENVVQNFENQDFTGYLTHVISGQTLSQNGTPISNVYLVVTNNESTYTNTQGYYEIDVIDGWSGTITPSKYGYYFEPATHEFVNVESDILFDFTGYELPEINGTISLSGGSGETNLVDITFDKHGSVVDDFMIHPNSQGVYSYQFDLSQIGIYDIIYTYYSHITNSYYPCKIENIVVESGTQTFDTILACITSEAVIVTTDSSGDSFYDIQDAINYLYGYTDNGGIVYVLPGTYSPENGLYISGNGKHIKVIGSSAETTIIDFQNTASSTKGFTFDDATYNLINEEDIISNLTIQNAGMGVLIKNGSPKISNVVIRDCTLAGSHQDIEKSAGITCYSSATIENCLIDNCTSNWLSGASPKYGYGGGIYIENNSNSQVIIRGNTISNCKAQNGGGIYCTGSSIANKVIIESNTITQNELIRDFHFTDYPEDAIGIIFYDCSNFTLEDNLIFDNIVYNGGHDYAIQLLNCNLDTIDVPRIVNNTIADNTYLIGIGLGIRNSSGNIDITNNIITNHWRGISQSNSSTIAQISYCIAYNTTNYSGVTADETCFSENPVDIYDENYYPLWNSTILSSCIDTGNPDTNGDGEIWETDEDDRDADGTPRDIGALTTFAHDYKEIKCEHNRVRWVSAPVIDRNIHAEGQYTEHICEPVEEQTDYFNIWDQGFINKIWENPDWTTEGLVNLYSKKGYKLDCDQTVTIPVSGIKMADDTVIDLYAGIDNWVGYFIKESMSIQDAFRGIWDHVIHVNGEDWADYKYGVIPHDRHSLMYGKMYIVQVDEDCSFVYGNKTQPVDPKEREMTEGFYYVEKADYTPINIIDLGDPNVEEVAVFQGDVCVGAAKVEDLPVQILAFADSDDRASDDISFQFFYGDRSYQKPPQFLTYQAYSNCFIEKDIELKPYETVVITFGEPDVPAPEKLSLSNYPNPFNPITQINYSLPVDGKIELIIYNIKGQKVKTLINGKAEAGHYNITWNSTDNLGRRVSSGVYFYQLKTAQKTLHKKMLLMK